MTLIQIFESREDAMSVKEVAGLLGVSDKHIYEMVADGRLPAFRVGRSIRFDADDIATWLREKKLQVRPDQVKSRNKPGRKVERLRPQTGNTALYGALRRRARQLEAGAACEAASFESATAKHS